MSLYAVVFYSDYRKENDWRIQCVFEDVKEATDFAKKYSRPETGQNYVTPNNKIQSVLLDQTCQPERDEDGNFKEEDENPDAPYEGMSWGQWCRVAVVEVPFKAHSS